MINQIERITRVVDKHLRSTDLRHSTGFAVSFCFGPCDMPDGSKQLMPIWLILLTLPSSLIGHPDYSLPLVIPAYAGMPPDKMFETTVDAGLELIHQKKEESERIAETK